MNLFTTYPSLIPILGEFNEAELRKVEVITLKPMEKLITKNTCDPFLYIILDGICDYIGELDTGTNVCHYKLSTNDIVGFYEFMVVAEPRMRPRVATIVARSKVVVACIPERVLRDALQHYPKFTLAVSVNIIERLHGALSDVFNCSTHSLQLNLITYLLHAYDIHLTTYPPLFTGAVKINETRQAISDYISVQPRSTNRAVDKLKSDELITLIKGKIHIDADQYKRMVALRTQLIENA